MDNRDNYCEHCGEELANCFCEEPEPEDNADELEYQEEKWYWDGEEI